MYNDKLVYRVVILAFFGISLWKREGSFNQYYLPIRVRLQYFIVILKVSV